MKAFAIFLAAVQIDAVPQPDAPQDAPGVQSQVSSPDGDVSTINSSMQNTPEDATHVPVNHRFVGTVATPSFDRNSYNRYFSILLNGANPANLYSGAQGGYSATDALTVGLNVPANASNHQANGIAVYINSHRSRAIGNGGDVAGYFQAVSSANNANVFGINSVAADIPNASGQALQNEMDFNLSAPSTSVEGLGLVLNASIAPRNAANALVCRTVTSVDWNACVYTPDGGAKYALYAGAGGVGNNRSSQLIAMASRSATGANFVSSVHSDAAGNLVLRSGAQGSTVAFQDREGVNNAHVGANGLVVSVGVLTLPGYLVARLPRCNSASKGSLAHATDLLNVSYNASARGGGANDAPVYCNGSVWTVH